MDHQLFEQMYQGQAPWDTGRPQPAIIKLAEAGQIRGSVLDVGCGTGQHVLMAAAMGLDAIGIDVSPTAIGVLRPGGRYFMLCFSDSSLATEPRGGSASRKSTPPLVVSCILTRSSRRARRKSCCRPACKRGL